MLMKHKYEYPITVSMLRDHKESVQKLFLSKNRHKGGVYLGVCFLEIDIMDESASELYSSLEFGERLSLVPVDTAKKAAYVPLAACRANGDTVGKLPFSDSLFPKKLLSLGVNVWCFVEATAMEADVFTAAVSIYCENY